MLRFVRASCMSRSKESAPRKIPHRMLYKTEPEEKTRALRENKIRKNRKERESYRKESVFRSRIMRVRHMTAKPAERETALAKSPREGIRRNNRATFRIAPPSVESRTAVVFFSALKMLPKKSDMELRKVDR